jgi:3,4-dihydroxy-2-butanone 4-phosphate synthase
MTDSRPPSPLRAVTPLPIDARDVIVPIEVALEEIRAGRMVVLVDDEDRENEGDLCMAAEKVTPEAINFMARFGRA